MKKTLSIIFVCLFLVISVITVFFILFPKRYADYISLYSDQYGVDRYIVASVINVESGYDSNAVSNAGAMGLMQILPTTAQDVADRLDITIEENDLFDVDTNIKIGCYYLSYLLKMFDGNIVNSLCAYNWGLNNVKNWINDGNIDESGSITNIPVKETRDYIKKYNVSSFVYKNIYKV